VIPEERPAEFWAAFAERQVAEAKEREALDRLRRHLRDDHSRCWVELCVDAPR
jgi:hypothetical protein